MISEIEALPLSPKLGKLVSGTLWGASVKSSAGTLWGASVKSSGEALR